MAFEIGQRVGDYEILELLGRGGMGHVYRARNIISDRIEAMKVLLPDLSAERDLAVRFISEIRTLAAFDHPNIAQLHTAFQSDNQLIMIMEFIEGVTLEQRAKQSPMSVPEVTGYVSQALSALSYAHARNVVHRDIKPANLMVTPHGVVKLMDFGIAKSNVDVNLTRPGTTIGSFYYMSPEQVRGSNVDARSDLYSIGIVLYELLAGRRPFESDSTYGVLNQQLNEAPKPPIELNPSLPPQLNSIILTALSKDPADRFQSADAFRNALKSFRNESPVEANAAAAVAAAPAAVAATPAANTPQPGFQNVSTPNQPIASTSRSHKPLWIATGAIAAMLALAAVAIFVPRIFKTHADTAAPAAQTTPQPTTQTTTQTPPAASGELNASQQSQPASPDASTPSSQPPNTASPATISTTPTPTPLEQPLATPVNHAITSAHAIHKAATNAAAAAQTEATPPQQTAAPQSTPEPSQAELDQLQERMTQLSARASAVDSSLSQIRSQQAAQGLGLRNDMAAAESRMKSYMGGANSDLQSGRIASAQKNMDRAESQIEILEKFLGK